MAQREKSLCAQKGNIMISKEQFIKAVHMFIENDMLPKAEGNYKIILNIARGAMHHKPDAIFNAIKNNSLVSMLDVIDDRDCIDIDMLAKILSDGLASDEFCFGFKLFGKEYTMHFSAGDIHTIKRYAM
jgi:hypothetical protein